MKYLLIPISFAENRSAQETVKRSVRERNHLDSFAFTQDDLNKAAIVESDGFGRIVPIEEPQSSLHWPRSSDALFWPRRLRS